ncbi:MAG: hypothetical protein LBJ61_04925, partial [Deltaproteobacteria bacterium]|nr:hypothetical protein [Deltaproteobacteria bacterium]
DQDQAKADPPAHGTPSHGQDQAQAKAEAPAHGILSPSQDQGQGHGKTPSEHPSEAKGDGFNVLFSASASLPPHDPNDTSGNPHAKHTSAHHLFESFVVLDKNLAKDDPQTTAAITRALIRGAQFVGENREQVADLAIKNGIWSGSKEAFLAEIARYMWMPGVSHAKEHLRYYIHEGLKRGTLPFNLDEKALFEQVFYQALPDVN